MTEETTEQLKARLKRQDEEKERAFQKTLEQIKADNAAWRAEKEAEERIKQQERERLLAGVRENRKREMKDSALRPWLDAGGTEEEFEQAWPEIRREMLKKRALGGVSQERRRPISATSGRSRQPSRGGSALILASLGGQGFSHCPSPPPAAQER